MKGPIISRWFFALLLFLLSFTIPTVASATPAHRIPGTVGQITEYTIPKLVNPQPYGIVLGSDGNFWITLSNAGLTQIAKMTPGGKFTEYAYSYIFTFANETLGPDGNVWLAEFWQGAIGKLTPKNYLTQFPFQTGLGVDYITTGPDGNLWFTEKYGGRVGHITLKGRSTQYSVPNSEPAGITTGPDGNIWFTDFTGNQIDRLTFPIQPGNCQPHCTAAPLPQITQFSLPTPGSEPNDITAGPDGNLWFTEYGSNQIGRITPTGQITEYPTPTSGSQPENIIAGSDGNLWFTEITGNNIGRITLDGTITEYPLPTANSWPYGLTTGPDGNIWFTENFSINDGLGRIGMITTK